MSIVKSCSTSVFDAFVDSISPFTDNNLGNFFRSRSFMLQLLCIRNTENTKETIC